MNTDTKILFMDLDGTLLDDRKQISKGNLDAIRQALSHGHKVVIATGRALISARKLAQALGLIMPGCYIIAYNGACIYDIYEKKTLYFQAISRECVFRLFDEAKTMGIHIHTYDDDGVITEQVNDNLLHYCQDTGLSYRLIPSIRQVLTWDPPKVLVADYVNQEPLFQFQKLISKWTEGMADSYLSSDALLELVAPGISKGSAIIRLCSQLQIPLESTISAGDADNDISMLTTTHTSVVMKNADPHMYAYATYVTEADNNHDGIAEAIYKFML